MYFQNSIVRNTHRILLFITWMILASCNEKRPTHENTVNPIIGDLSYKERFGALPDASSDEFTRIQTHLLYAEQILRKKETSHLNAFQLCQRYHLLDLLHAYALNGQFPMNTKYAQERKPCFIDDKGTICAVGYLIEQSVGLAFAEKINSLFQYNTIAEMGMPELQKWIEASGFSAEEIATIQPTYNYYYAPPSKTVLAGGGMSSRGLAHGYPSIYIGIENIKNKNRNTILMNYQSLGPNDNQAGVRFGIARDLFTHGSFGFGLTPSFYIDNDRNGSNLKPDMAFSLMSESGENMSLQLMMSYGYDFAMTRAENFPISRHDLSVHLLLKFGKATRFRDF